MSPGSRAGQPHRSSLEAQTPTMTVMELGAGRGARPCTSLRSAQWKPGGACSVWPVLVRMARVDIVRTGERGGGQMFCLLLPIPMTNRTQRTFQRTRGFHPRRMVAGLSLVPRRTREGLGMVPPPSRGHRGVSSQPYAASPALPSPPPSTTAPAILLLVLSMPSRFQCWVFGLKVHPTPDSPLIRVSAWTSPSSRPPSPSSTAPCPITP